MKPIGVWIVAAALATASAAWAQDACTERYGTQIDWQKDYEKACGMAAEEGRLLFILHLSGELPDSGRT